MEKQLLILFECLILVGVISTHQISNISNVTCVVPGIETFDLEVIPEGSIESLSEFKVTLKNEAEEELTASCMLDGPSSDTVIDISDSSSNLFDTKEAKSDSTKDSSDSIVDESDKLVSSDSDSTYIDSIPKETVNLDSDKETNSYLLTQTQIDSSTQLEEDISATTITYRCLIDKPGKSGSYKLESVDNSALKITTNITAELISCQSEEDLLKRANITLSFRQVSSFDRDKLTFNFYGLTTKNINKEFSIFFMIYLIIGTGKMPTPIEIECTTAEDITITADIPIAMVTYTCTIPSSEETKELVSIEIDSSENVAALPANETLLNPVLTDAAIKSNLLEDKAKLPVPQLTVLNKDSFKYDSVSEGLLEFTITFGEITDTIIVGRTFDIVFIEGMYLVFTVTKIEGTILTLCAEMHGTLDNQFLAFEQTIITIGGKEAFVLPGFVTERITTEGFPEEETTTNSVTLEEATTEQALTTQVETTTEAEKNGTEEYSVEIEEAIKKAEIFITFRQINGFSFVPGIISFNFYALITQSLNLPYTVVLFTNLVSTQGMEENETEIKCQLQSKVDVTDGESKQASFKCEKKGLNASIEYTSLKLNSSEVIAGIPFDDETALNPALTDEAISNGEIKNSSNSSSSDVPPSFTFESMDLLECSKDGKFLIKGNLSKKKSIPDKFTIPLTYPEGALMTCSFKDNDIQCIADQELSDSVIIEQTIVADGAEELFILKKVIQNGMKCENGLQLQAEEKLNVNISFRQVSHIVSKTNGLSFFFAAFVNSNLAKSYLLKMNVIVIINGEKVEKVANCTLKDEVKVSSGKKTQGDFNCEVALESNEKVAVENLTISTDNENIGGCSELTKEELSPYLTDEAIKKSSDTKLGLVLDYSLEENKEIIPPTFKISNMNFNKCEKKGKIKIEGTFSSEITEEMTFELPFSFPKSKVKCKVENAQANAKVEITCKMQKIKDKLTFKKLVLEPRLLKKKHMEMLYIEKANIPLSEGKTCQNYNQIKLQRAKARKNANFFFLQMGRPMGYTKLFFLALTKKMYQASFTTIKIEVTLTVERKRRRNLDTVELDDPLSITCTPTDAQTSDSCALDCTGGDGSTPITAELEDDQIAGAPDEITVETNPNPDFSKLEALKEFDSLPSVNITKLTSNNCSNTGKFIIEGVYEGELSNADNITIPFSSPDSSGLCSMEVDSSNKKITMNCENTESFEASEIILSPQTIYDQTGNKNLFKITNDFTAPKQFACEISDNSLKITTSPDGSSSNSYQRFRKNSSSGLSGGAIAGIVIACVAVVAIIGTLIVLTKKGFFSKPRETATSIDNTSTINKFQMDDQNKNMV